MNCLIRDEFPLPNKIVRFIIEFMYFFSENPHFKQYTSFFWVPIFTIVTIKKKKVA